LVELRPIGGGTTRRAASDDNDGPPSAEAWIARARPPFKHAKLPNKRLGSRSHLAANGNGTRILRRRLSTVSGVFGVGIYFTDHSRKALQNRIHGTHGTHKSVA
jgi:hypothetical protein